MTCLRAARAQGAVPSSDLGLWGGLVPLSLLQQALLHKHDQVSLRLSSGLNVHGSTAASVLDLLSSPQVRMDALGLVCESHRSTEVLTPQEMDLIRHFLIPNLNSQSPGVRQQTVSLLKKVRGQQPKADFIVHKK